MAPLPLKAVHTSFWFCILGGLLAFYRGCLLSPLILTAMKSTPAGRHSRRGALSARLFPQGALFTISLTIWEPVRCKAFGRCKHPASDYLCLSSASQRVAGHTLRHRLPHSQAGVAKATLIAQADLTCLCVMEADSVPMTCRLVPSQMRSDRAMGKDIIIQHSHRASDTPLPPCQCHCTELFEQLRFPGHGWQHCTEGRQLCSAPPTACP